MISLTIENLTKRFGDSVALDRINLHIEAGEIFFLLGPSGCGKTTLLRSVAGFYAPDGGRILFGDEDVTALPPHLRNTGMMFQSYALWPHMSVAKNVAFGLEERRVRAPEIAQRVVQALESVRMGGFGERRIHQLSGGQQQRVALARALVIRPRCLLLDEPLSNLDARLRLEMRTEIRRICKEFGLTAIYVTHDQKEALSIADRMAVLEGGHIRQTGRPADVYRHPHSKFIADFMGETNFIDGTVTSVSGTEVVVETPLRAFSATLGGNGWQPAAGTRCTLSIRPESWTLGTAAGARNAVAGRIRERIYLGEMAQYQFAAGSPAMEGVSSSQPLPAAAPHRLKIFELNPRFVDASDDRDLFASVSPEDAVVLPA